MSIMKPIWSLWREVQIAHLNFPNACSNENNISLSTFDFLFDQYKFSWCR